MPTSERVKRQFRPNFYHFYKVYLMNSTETAKSTDTLHDWQRSFIEFALEKQVLQFGEFTLKSGRVSPYFFNAGNFNDGESQQRIGEIYAKTLVESDIDFDLVFGPAYKGIPLAASTVFALQNSHGQNKFFSFNRKEAKDHGEGGTIVGAPLEGNLVLVDDVITAGTAIKETLSLLEAFPSASLTAAVILIDRQEKLADSDLSAIQALEQNFGLRILPAIRLDQIMKYLEDNGNHKEALIAMKNYREQYGV
ncbi:orotate phosphoribosyltransferase [Reinekea marina]|uniref:orotate phosphoribosyltransferase n=1 Tax=Reinekea marina TaxID=1310421 RepID=UPI003F490DD8